MSGNREAAIKDICASQGKEKGRMMDIVRAVQEHFGCVSDEAIDIISKEISIPRVEVESTVSFYSFLSKSPKGKIVIRLCNDIIDRMHGYDLVAEAFKKELGIDFGETTADGLITLENTACIGMSDQAPSALVNNEIVNNLSTDRVRNIVKILRESGDPKQLVHQLGLGEGYNSDPLIRSMVYNNIRRKGEVILAFADFKPNVALEKALAMSPVEVINEVKNARLRGRGGAGFPAGMKWEFTRGAEGKKKYVLCNADEGEPGTFKDRVLLTELSDRVFEGMTVAGYAIGAQEGILYLRGEYSYLYTWLERVLQDRREAGLLGKSVMGKEGFDFDVRIQLGAGAYICGEETALISSCEGLRGEGWFAEIGSKGSAGTKLLSVSGDCEIPGIYEVPFGTSINELLEMVGAEDAIALQIGGPSGQMIGKADYDRTICYDDLATGGSVMVFGPHRNLLEVVDYFMDFFIDESCGYCTPCRVGNVLLKNYLEKVMQGKGEPADLDVMKELGKAVKLASRCGLGQTSPNPILTSMEKFRSTYDDLVQEAKDGLQPAFDIKAALADSEKIAGRESVHFE